VAVCKPQTPLTGMNFSYSLYTLNKSQTPQTRRSHPQIRDNDLLVQLLYNEHPLSHKQSLSRAMKN